METSESDPRLFYVTMSLFIGALWAFGVTKFFQWWFELPLPWSVRIVVFTIAGFGAFLWFAICHSGKGN